MPEAGLKIHLNANLPLSYKRLIFLMSKVDLLTPALGGDGETTIVHGIKKLV